jgi:hypothetical protein
MSNSITIPVSRTYKDAFKQAFERYINANQPVLPVSYSQLPVNG